MIMNWTVTFCVSTRVLTEAGSEDDDSAALSMSSVHTDLSVPEQLASPSSDQPVSEVHSPHTGNSPAPDTLYSLEFNATDSKQVKTEFIHKATPEFNATDSKQENWTWATQVLFFCF